MLDKKTILVGFILLISLGNVAHATTINVINQDGQPLADVVLEIPLHHSEENDFTTPLIMDQIDKSFAPNVLIAPKNSLVSFPNSDDIRHHVYSFSAAKTFELKLYAARPKNPVEFEQEGIVVLGCNIHDSMVGYIYVHDNTYTVKSNVTGKIEIDEIPALAKSFYLWHPNAMKGVEHREMLPIALLKANNKEITLTLNTKTPVPRNTFGELGKHAH
ncbi:methylamine utilization protein [Thalassotalea castellviae]|uniref:Methylamine utilization protein n=1 Tax=Thalassotalea castellviae TaxID=3075612 RepID=A0ABU3A1B4_9GAMM|nr:methylamine utilization protein [Thalassotalea sp. W431]MDT0603968.1 methylamine utilization protein [Thalassotalea sp. W431]